MKQNAVAIITGGASGIGLGITKKFVEEGILCCIIGRNTEKLAKAKAELGDLCKTFAFDMTHLKGIPGLVEIIASEFGSIDILVNNAGINMKKPFLEVTDEDFLLIINTNLVSVFSLSREVGKVMVNQGNGSIIHISSMSAHYGIPKIVAYTASKTALEGMTRSMAVDLSPLGIRVNSIAPGFIITPMTAKAFDSDADRKNRVIARTPMGKMGLPEDIANTAFFLGTDASGFITGETIKVDGGNSIGF